MYLFLPKAKKWMGFCFPPSVINLVLFIVSQAKWPRGHWLHALPTVALCIWALPLQHCTHLPCCCSLHLPTVLQAQLPCCIMPLGHPGLWGSLPTVPWCMALLLGQWQAREAGEGEPRDPGCCCSRSSGGNSSQAGAWGLQFSPWGPPVGQLCCRW